MPKELTINIRGEVAEVLLYDSIGEDRFFGGGISAETFRKQINGIKAKSLNLRINSGGGSATEAKAMFQALEEFPGRIEVDIDGLAASAATFLAMAGDKVRMGDGALFMIHEAWSGVTGNAADFRRAAQVLDMVNEMLVDTYMRRVKMSKAELLTAMEDETWYDARGAVKAGFADEVAGQSVRTAAMVDGLKMAAALGWKHVPEPPKPACISKEEHAKRVAMLAALGV